MTNPRIGSTFDSLLANEGILEEVDALAQKRVIAWQIEHAMEEQGITKVEMAARMHTSRAQLDRLLDPDNNKVQLDTLQRAAKAVGGALKLELVSAAAVPRDEPFDRIVSRARKAAKRAGLKKKDVAQAVKAVRARK